MSYIKDKLILWCIIDIMKPYHQLDRSETRSEMARIHRTALDHILTDLRTEVPEFIKTQFLDILRRIYGAKYLILTVFHRSIITDLRRYKKNATFAKII